MNRYGQSNLSDQDRNRKRNELQRESIMLESDLRRLINQKTLIDAEERKIKKEITRLKMDLQDRQKKIQNIERDIVLKQTEQIRLKKQMNLV